MSQLKLESPGTRPARILPAPVMLDSKMVDTTEAGWISLDVTGAVERWHNHKHRPMALMLQVEDNKKRSLLPNSYLQPLSCDAGTAGSQGGQQDETSVSLLFQILPVGWTISVSPLSRLP